MLTIGFSFGFHDSSLSLIQDGKILGVYSEERFSKIKHDKSFPSRALEYAIDFHKLDSTKIDLACFYENSAARILRSRSHFNSTQDFVSHLARKDYIDPIKLISTKLGVPLEKVKCVDHHTSHAFNSFILDDSQGQKLSLTIDGVGEFDTACTYTLNEENKLTKDILGTFPDSIGLFYSALTSYLGFEVNDAEFKVMGLAAYGEPNYFNQLNQVIWYDQESKTIQTNHEYLSVKALNNKPYNSRFF